MDLAAFTKTLSETEPPASLSIQLNALWYDAKGDWDAAHDLINDLEDLRSAWVHAYLHRKEGDPGNAQYWYKRAGKPMPNVDLAEEWRLIVSALL
jgi:hypothetical protein